MVLDSIRDFLIFHFSFRNHQNDRKTKFHSRRDYLRLNSKFHVEAFQ